MNKNTKEEYILRLFIRFLKDEHIYHTYMIYITNHCINSTSLELTIKQHIDKLIRENNKYFLLAAFFTWSETIEGNDFWLNKSTKWGTLIAKHIK